MKILVFMYDKRMYSLRDKLLLAGYETVEVNNQEDIDFAAKSGSTLDGIILPVQGVEDNGQMKMKGLLFDVTELFENISSKCVIFAGVKRDYLNKSDNKVIYLFSQEEVMIQNALITAEGLLHQMIAYTDISIFDCRVDLVGYGHVGKAMAELLTRLKIPVTLVFTRPKDQIKDEPIVLNGQEIRVKNLEEWQLTEPSEIIIITAPIEVINETTSESWTHLPLVIDMAKGRCGVSGTAINSGKMTVIKAPALPALAAPKTAGTILADYIISYYS